MSIRRSDSKSAKTPAPAQKAPDVVDKNSARVYKPAHVTEMSSPNTINMNSLSAVCSQPYVSIATVGEPSVGKTTALLRFAKRTFESRRVATVGFDRLPVYIKSRHPYYDRVTCVTLLDTAGQERYHSFTPVVLRDVEAVMLFFDASRRSTFEECKAWRKLITSVNSWCLCMLIASKMDIYRQRDEKTGQFKVEQWMATPDMKPEERAKVVQQGGVDIAAAAKDADLNCDAGVHFVSSLDGTGIDAAFVDLVDQAIEYQQRLAMDTKPMPGGSEVAQIGSRRQHQQQEKLDLRSGGVSDVRVTNKISCC